MDKKDVAAALTEVATLLELSGENAFKIRSYTNTARVLEQYEGNFGDLVAEGRLRELKGVGEALEEKISTLAVTGRLDYLEKLRAQFPSTLYELFDIPGLGPKRIRVVYEELEVDSLDKLEQACSSGKLRALKGFSEKLEKRIVQGIDFVREHQGRFLLGHAFPVAKTIEKQLAEHPGVERVSIAGSLRRGADVVKDIDLVASSSSPEEVMDYFVGLEDVEKVLGKGSTKTSVQLKAPPINVDLRVVADDVFPSTLAHFTGNRDHNIAMRQRAKAQDLKLNEYGLGPEDGPPLHFTDEAALYGALGLPWIPPELRENRGELELTSVPSLVCREDLKGLIHFHTTWSDGRGTLQEMVDAARDMGYHYAVVTDHSQSAHYAGGLLPEAVARQQAEVDALNEGMTDFRVLKGIESDIRTDGSLDYDDEVLATFDLVIASVHSDLEMDKDKATERIVRAIENPYTHIIGHISQRLLLRRKGYALDYERVFDAAAANGVAIEINGNPNRLDIDWRHIRQGQERGVRFAIGPDAHRVEGIANVDYGLGIARKGWLEAAHVLNTMTAEELLAWRK